jgi:Flp pilus assembly protein TadB
MPILIVVSIVLVVGCLAIGFVLLSGGGSNQGGFAKGQLKAMVNSQRFEGRAKQDDIPKKTSIFAQIKQQDVHKRKSAALTITKKLKYGQWKMPVPIFHICEIIISILWYLAANAFVGAATGNKLSFVFQMLVLFTTGPITMRALLNRSVNRRFKAFDRDYPSFLLSLVGLVKTGMTPLGAIEAGAKGLEDGSLIKLECELMLERLRVGVPEEASIGAFADEVFHPEIELFVQALLLSRRVGGTLSDTLDRLARQIRKRQYFRGQAVAAVGLQRGSIVFILVIMILLECYLAYIYPQAVWGAMKDPIGWDVWQFGIGIVLVGMFWVKQVTKIKV